MELRDSLIKLLEQDIKHNQLLNGLHEIGFYDNEKYTVDVVSTIVAIMDKKDSNGIEEWLDIYHSTIMNIPHNLTPKEAYGKAISLFDSLSKLD